jgi:hypothetical protein
MQIELSIPIKKATLDANNDLRRQLTFQLESSETRQ